MESINNHPIFAIAGPTCSGKTALGVKLAKHLNGEVINFDSVQIYKGVSIATAKPSEAETEGIPHHLIDYVDPNTTYTAADWAKDATAKISEIERRESTAILVGGTGFYLRTLRNPLFEGPSTDQRLRERLKRIGESRGTSHLFKIISRVDPSAATKLEPKDSVRIIRALEVFFQTGQKISELQPKRAEPPDFTGRIKLFVLSPPRDLLYKLINERSERHFEAGLVEEVIELISQGVRTDRSALGAHGYRRVCEYLKGERTLESAVEKTQQDVRNYAKRQLTWYRREKDAIWLNGFGNEQITWNELLQYL